MEKIKKIDEEGREYWSARELQKALEYKRWDKFKNVINNSILNCQNINKSINNHFSHAGKMVDIGSKTTRVLEDYKLSRYACYLIVMNCDPRKEIIALAQTYFAVKTRLQEISEKEYSELTEDEKRLYRRKQVKTGNYNLNKTAINSGVKDLARFHNARYKGLYNGETANDIFRRFTYTR